MSDNYVTSLKTLKLAEKYKWIIPSVGLHPWSVNINSVEEVKIILELVRDKNNQVKILGEIGLDKKFKPDTYSYQLNVFKLFIDIAKEMNMVLNVHAAGAWRETLDILIKNDISMAIFHWYTGPLDLIKEITDVGYFITINPAIAIQQKHRDVVAQAPIDIILVESDAPYKYKGIELHPKHIFDVIKWIALIKGIDNNEIYKIILKNIQRLLKRIKYG